MGPFSTRFSVSGNRTNRSRSERFGARSGEGLSYGISKWSLFTNWSINKTSRAFDHYLSAVLNDGTTHTLLSGLYAIKSRVPRFFWPVSLSCYIFRARKWSEYNNGNQNYPRPHLLPSRDRRSLSATMRNYLWVIASIHWEIIERIINSNEPHEHSNYNEGYVHECVKMLRV